MIKTRMGLAALAFVGSVFTMSPDLARAEDLDLGLKLNKKPYEQIKEYLDVNGVVREEFRHSHYFFKDGNGDLHYNRSYIIEGKLFVEQYDISRNKESNENGDFLMFFAYPSAFLLEGNWYFDPYKDGFNGNEVDGLEKEPPI